MVKVRVRGVNGQKKLIIARAKRLARIAVSDPKAANAVKNMLLLPIKKTGILPSGKKAKSLSIEWAKRRRKLGKINKTSKFFRNFFSNLTMSGQFLKSFKVKISATKRSSSKLGNNSSAKILYRIAPEGSHKGYKLIKGGTSPSVDNAVIGQGLIENGRDYTVISEENKAKIAKKLIGRIRRELKLKLNL